MNKNILTTILILFIFILNAFSQDKYESIQIKDIEFDFENIRILFQKHEEIGMLCEYKKEKKHCEKVEKIFDNNLAYLQTEFSNTMFYLSVPHHLTTKDSLALDDFSDLNRYRYVFESIPKLSDNGSSCFANPGALYFEFILFDRLKNIKYSVDLSYSLFICDIQILVNEINKNFKKKTQ